MRFASFVALITLGWLASYAVAEERAPIQPRFLMDQEPAEVALPENYFLHSGLLPLWKQALTHPESELQRQTAEAIITLQEFGHEGLTVFQPELVSILKQENAHPATRYAVARALIVLNCRDTAALLFKVSQEDSKILRQLVEPVLSEWGFAPIQAVWIERVKNSATPRRDLQLAISGLSRNRVLAAQADLLQIALTTTRPNDLRLSAARAAGEIAEQGLEPSARQLLARSSKTLIDRLCAAALLVRHRSPESIELNRSLAIDSEPAVAGIALRTLFATDPQAVVPIAEASLKSHDAPVRRVAIETYIQLPTVERLTTLVSFLNDPHPELRGLVREGFFTHSSDTQYQALIRESSIRVLAGDDWRGQEQAALLLAALDHKEIAPRLVKLLQSDHDEVMIATAWALRVLAVPDTAAAITAQISRRTKIDTFFEPGIEHQVSHLCEALAHFRHKPATPVLALFVPKTAKYGPLSRSAAIWSLGRIYEDAAGTPTAKTESSALTKAAEFLGLLQKPEGELVEDLASRFMERVEDTDSQIPEWPAVRRTSALALGRMKATSQLEPLKDQIGDQVESESVELAMRWAVLRISGEDLPIAPPQSYERKGWFLEPTTDSLPNQPVTPSKIRKAPR